jgi:hypothetical protein
MLYVPAEPNCLPVASAVEMLLSRRILIVFTVLINQEADGNSSRFEVVEDLELKEIQAVANELNSELPNDRDGDYAPMELNQLHGALDSMDGILVRAGKKSVLDVLRRHLQEVLRAINTTPEQAAATEGISFGDLDSIMKENADSGFM